MVERRRVLRLAAEALDELVVVRVAAVEDLDRDPAAELLVLGEVDVGHPAGPELALDPVAPVEEGVDERVAYRHGRLKGRDTLTGARSFSRMALAIGAEIEPPKPFGCFSTTTATT